MGLILQDADCLGSQESPSVLFSNNDPACSEVWFDQSPFVLSCPGFGYMQSVFLPAGCRHIAGFFSVLEKNDVAATGFMGHGAYRGMPVLNIYVVCSQGFTCVPVIAWLWKH